MQNRTTYIRVTIILIAGALSLFAFAFSHSDKSTRNAEEIIKPVSAVKIGDARFHALLADTPFLRQRGLSNRPFLEEDEGMLFIFDESEERQFWMKEMLFPLDMVWIDENKKVVGITENVLPESYPDAFSSEVPVRYVLEINANVAEKSGITVGEEVELIR